MAKSNMYPLSVYQWNPFVGIIDRLTAEKQAAEEDKKIMKAGLSDYEKQIKNMRKSLRRWCKQNHIKINDEGFDILSDC